MVCELEGRYYLFNGIEDGVTVCFVWENIIIDSMLHKYGLEFVLESKMAFKFGD